MIGQLHSLATHHRCPLDGTVGRPQSRSSCSG